MSKRKILLWSLFIILLIIFIIILNYSCLSLDHRKLKLIGNYNLNSGDTPPGYFLYNPSCVYSEKDGGFYIIYRISNKGCGKNPEITHNLGRLTFVKNPKDSPLIYSTFDYSDIFDIKTCKNYGIEDVRLFIKQNNLWGVGTYVSDKCVNKMILIKFDKEKLKPISYTLLRYTDDKTNEKNWSPIIDDDHNIKYVYSWDPFVIIQQDDNGQMKEILRDSTVNLKNTRGGTQVIFNKNTNEYYTIVHVRELSGKNYRHSMITLTKEMKIKSVTPLSCIQPNYNFQLCGIEFASGLSITNCGKFILTYGTNDCNSKIVIFEFDLSNKR